ncbi:MAG: UDP-N-acetylmuramate dehydrogenase [Spirochaetaceae bacterium]|jgi:UDP-N-acetylmuramate dehydrogenase|nr:UDP-N-acetylmuramate dehydrogenase [Spirochaetaceae bacterium]
MHKILHNVPLAPYTTFNIGGPADNFIVFDKTVLQNDFIKPLFILGGGANILVSDRGVRGTVVYMGEWTGWGKSSRGGAEARSICIKSGTPIEPLVDDLCKRGIGGLEFLAGMPGTIGGAVYMNARAYDKEIADILIETEVLEQDETGAWTQKTISRFPNDFSYKRSPFYAPPRPRVSSSSIILSATFKTYVASPSELIAITEAHKQDRTDKGHYRYPSAGSVFKNNRAFGKPTGKIIEELGLRGLQIGGAQIAPWHGNFIINTGNATANDVRELITTVQVKAKAALGIDLEPEVLFVGDWD